MNRFLCLLLATLLLAGCDNGKNVLLKFNLQKGKAYVYTMKSDMEQDVQGRKAHSDFQFVYSLEVTDDQNGIKTLKTTYDSLTMNMTMGTDAPLHIDSNMPAVDTASNTPLKMMSGMFRAMKGKSFTMKVDANGEVKEVSGLNEMAESMINEMNVDPASKPMIKQTFMAQFNNETVKNNFSQAFNMFPNKPVKVGDSWQKTISLPGAMSTSMNTTYTVKSITDNRVTLDSKARFKGANMEGNQEGTVVIDPGTGLLISGDFQMKFGAPMNMTTKGTMSGREK